MKQAVIIQSKGLKDLFSGSRNLRQQGFIFNSRYSEFYKIFNSIEELSAAVSDLNNLVSYPNCIEEGNVEVIEELVKELQLPLKTKDNRFYPTLKH